MSKVIAFIFATWFSISFVQAEEIFTLGEVWTVVTESDELNSCLEEDTCRSRRLQALNEYIVQVGDTQYSIAKSRGLSVEELLFANPNVVLNELTVGQTLKFPSID